MAKPTSGAVAQFFRYGLMTGVSGLLSFGVPVFLHEIAGVDPKIAFAVGLGLAFAVNFFSTRHYVFKSQGTAGGDLVRFVATSALFRIFEYTLFIVLNEFLSLVYYLSIAVVLTLSILMKFLAYRNFVFSSKNRKSSQVSSPRKPTEPSN